ncbi:MAG TPA: helix-turn-helix domain-containing protein [Nitrososphaerales archaeon]|nr:helix-turn-helix domain-containing protein [Nitrososphaerales archaeon]
MGKEKLLFDPSSHGGMAKRVIVSPRPDDFRPASGRVGQRILELLSAGPKYPAEIARALGVHHQTVYYHVGRLEKAGLIARVRSQVIRGGEANLFALSSDGYAVEFPVKGERMPTISSASRSKALGRFFQEFIVDGELDAWIVVGSPTPHGAGGTQARDGHYAVQLGFALGQFVRLPERFPVKLDVDLKAEKLLGSNLIIVGGPRTNVIAEELNPGLPIRFKQGGFWGSITDEGGRLYNSELDCIVAKVRNPWNREKSCVLAAGLTGAGTKAAIIGICNEAESLFQKYTRGDFVCVLRGVDRDGDGKVDSVDALKTP